MTSLKTISLCLAALSLLACGGESPSPAASKQAAAKSPEHNVDGKIKACATCHGDKGMSTASEWPNLAGQKAGFMVVQMKAFRDGERQEPLMSNAMKGLSDQDIEALAAYYSQQIDDRPKPESAYEPGAHVRAHCISCHGKTGKTVNQLWPNLAGQQEAYLVKALMDYKTGKRKNPIMEVIANELSDQQINDVAKYYSQVSAK